MIVPTTSPTNAPIEIQDVICYYKALNLKYGDRYQYDISISDMNFWLYLEKLLLRGGENWRIFIKSDIIQHNYQNGI